MGQVLHGCATTTEAIRRAIQHSQESLRSPSKRYGINPKTVAKWKKRGAVADLKTGPKDAKSSAFNRGRGDHRHLLQAPTLAPRRLPLRPSGYNTTPDPFVLAPLSPAPGGSTRRSPWRSGSAAGNATQRTEQHIGHGLSESGWIAKALARRARIRCLQSRCQPVQSWSLRTETRRWRG